MDIKGWIKNKARAKENDDWKTILIQFIKFGLVGVSNTIVSWAFYYFFLWIDEQLYMVGGFVGTVVSIANAFFWNNRFVFKDDNNDLKNTIRKLIKTYISYGGTSLLGMLLLYIEVEVFGISKALAPPFNLIITIPLNFVLNKFWTFKKSKEVKK
jgi:putative flippase GtrA